MGLKKTIAPKEVFLSHSSRNNAFVQKFAQALQAQGIKVWYSAAHIRGAQQWHDEIGLALKRCDWFAVILSPSSVRSRWVKRELIHALNDPRYDERILPVLYKKCDLEELSWTLSAFQTVNFTQSFESGWHELKRIWTLP